MSSRGLTLVELLVVIAVICTLAATMMPLVSRAQDSALRAQCLANLRQLTHTAAAWATEHEGAFPPGLLHGTQRDCLSGDVRAWDWHRLPNGTVRPGILWARAAGRDAGDVMQCPTCRHVSPAWSGDPVTGYNYNVAFIAAEARPPTASDKGLGAQDLITAKANLDGETHLTLAQCRRGSHTALFGTGGRRGGTNKFMRSPVNAGPVYDIAYAGAQAFPDGSNVARVDGSVGTVRIAKAGIHADALPDWIVDQLDHPRNGFLSDDASAYDPR
ncbi:MAG: type II secretion system GspH family protein [Phycisphaerales bacterium]|nr:type II secretion system GspH family protein [Phycisphaerales bacterium]